MKTLINMILATVFCSSTIASNTLFITEKASKDSLISIAQDSLIEVVNVNKKVKIIRIDNSDSINTQTRVIRIGEKQNIKVEEDKDTVIVKIGNNTVRVIEKNDGATVFLNGEKIDKKNFNLKHIKKNRKKKSRFNGHLSLLEVGSNNLTAPDYSNYSADDNYFLDLRHSKSTEWNLNLFKKSVGLQKTKNNIGLVTGIGINWNNYRFDKDVTLIQENNIVKPKYLTNETGYGDVKKSKLTTTYVTVPLLIEFQSPRGSDKFYFSIGGIGAVKVNSYTRIDHGNKKDKSHESFYVNPFRYGFTSRIGYGGFYIYGTYYQTPLFESDRGPTTNPYSIGIGFIQI